MVVVAHSLSSFSHVVAAAFGTMSDVESDKGILLHSICCFVTWERSRMEDHEEFYRKLRADSDRIFGLSGTQMFGVKESRENGTFDYRVVMKFPRRVRWLRAQEKFILEDADGKVDTETISIEAPDLRRESFSGFLERTQAFCVDGDNSWTFGDRIEIGCNMKAPGDKRSMEALGARFPHRWKDYDEWLESPGVDSRDLEGCDV
jgi:hypothetical protein